MSPLGPIGTGRCLQGLRKNPVPFSTAEPSRLAALLVGRTLSSCALLAPGLPDAVPRNVCHVCLEQDTSHPCVYVLSRATTVSICAVFGNMSNAWTWSSR